MNILIIEDDIILSNSLKNCFQKNSFANIVNILHSYNEYLFQSNISCYDIILLDICLGSDNLNGIELLKDIRQKDLKIPVIMISSFDDYRILEETFYLGAHDYVIKPFRNRELQIRMKRWFNNYVFHEYYSIKKVLSYKCLSYDLGSCEFYIEDKIIKLSKSSKYIFLILLIHKEKLVKNDFLIEKIWGECDVDKNLRIKILRLKQGLKLSKISNWIKTVRGEGYILQSPDNI